LEPGECFGLLGLNGAGKTTTFKCITQEIAPDNGEIFVFGKEIRGKFNELKKVFGYCPQFDAIFEYLTVYENLEFYARIKGIKRNLVHQLVTSMIEEMSLTEFTNKISGRMSGGNKRKLSVAISMIGNPPIILLDEPSTGMDPEARRFMWSVIHKMSTKGKKSSVIMTTHSMDEAETLCRRMGIMVNGEFVCIGTANEIKEKYGYGYEADIRIKPMSHEKQRDILDDAELDYDLKVTNKNINEILEKLGKQNYYEELKPGRLGERLQKTLNINGSINIGILLNWLFFVENALKFIKVGKQYFSEIILSEHIENNFLFRLKKGKETKSIGFFFGLFDGSKEECNITEYTIQQTSLEQIFNKFASNQGVLVDDINIEDDANEKKGIYIDDELLSNLNI
jgi:ATP-binding cassette subfamily A (ABC1) protein 3